MESIINFFIKLFSGLVSLKFGKELIVFIISLFPILELRGGLIAAAILGVKPLNAYIVSIIGNLLPIPFILLFLSKVLDWMEKSKVKLFNKTATWLRKKADKNKNKIEKYGYWGLILFVGIPLPGTGAWTGSLVATALNLDKKKAFLCTIVGVLIASIIMMFISYGIIDKLI
ncbi:MAG: small multi-drug export protein [Bacilli bacterium]|nr:small multi-drug export protein [Bacilli bacterium]